TFGLSAPVITLAGNDEKSAALNRYDQNKFVASCIATTPAMSDSGSPISRGRLGSSVIGTTPSGFGSGHGSFPTSRGFHPDSAPITSSPDSVCGPWKRLRCHFHTCVGVRRV